MEHFFNAFCTTLLLNKELRHLFIVHLLYCLKDLDKASKPRLIFELELKGCICSPTRQEAKGVSTYKAWNLKTGGTWGTGKWFIEAAC